MKLHQCNLSIHLWKKSKRISWTFDTVHWSRFILIHGCIRTPINQSLSHLFVFISSTRTPKYGVIFTSQTCIFFLTRIRRRDEKRCIYWPVGKILMKRVGYVTFYFVLYLFRIVANRDLSFWSEIDYLGEIYKSGRKKRTSAWTYCCSFYFSTVSVVFEKKFVGISVSSYIRSLQLLWLYITWNVVKNYNSWVFFQHI